MKLCAKNGSSITSWKTTSMLNFNQRVAQKMITLQIKVKSQLFKEKNDHQVATGGKHGVLSCPQAAGRNAASTCCYMIWAAMGSVCLFLRNQWSRQKPSSTRLPAFCGPLFTPLQTLNPKKLPKK